MHARVNVLATPRLTLRGWRDADLEPWARMNANPRVMEFFPATWTRERSNEVARRCREQLERDGYGWWIVEVHGILPFAGVIALQDVPFEASFTPAHEIGWRFSSEAWGHGYATEAARAALALAFEQLGWEEVVAMTAVHNLRSQRVMQRLGMQRDYAHDFEHPMLPEGHVLRPHVLYRLPRERLGGGEPSQPRR